MTDTFEISTGLVVLPGPQVDDHSGPRKLKVELRRTDGSIGKADGQIEYLSLRGASPIPAYALFFGAMAKADIPIGTEIWPIP